MPYILCTVHMRDQIYLNARRVIACSVNTFVLEFTFLSSSPHTFLEQHVLFLQYCFIVIDYNNICYINNKLKIFDCQHTLIFSLSTMKLSGFFESES